MKKILVLLLTGTLFSCSPKVVTKTVVENHYQHDTIVQIEVKDSIVERIVEKRDSSASIIKNDTIIIERWHWERDYRYEKLLQSKIDSISSSGQDSIPYEVEIPVYVEKPLKTWQKGMIGVGFVCIFMLILTVIIKISDL